MMRREEYLSLSLSLEISAALVRFVCSRDMARNAVMRNHASVNGP